MRFIAGLADVGGVFLIRYDGRLVGERDFGLCKSVDNLG